MRPATILSLFALATLPVLASAQNAAPPMTMPGMDHNPGVMTPASMALMRANETMMKDMNITMSGKADRDFAVMMIAHHQGAIEMAKAELQYGKEPELKELAQRIIAAQETEIALMKDWITRDQADDHH
ncbi:MAG: DUF305 domain-containing protein [Bauldia sp.]